MLLLLCVLYGDTFVLCYACWDIILIMYGPVCVCVCVCVCECVCHTHSLFHLSHAQSLTYIHVPHTQTHTHTPLPLSPSLQVYQHWVPVDRIKTTNTLSSELSKHYNFDNLYKHRFIIVYHELTPKLLRQYVTQYPDNEVYWSGIEQR